jgi:hypothetical protein
VETIFTLVYWKESLKMKHLAMHAISIKLGTNHSWMNGIQVYSNEGPNHLQRGDNHKSAKIGWGHLYTFFS